MYLLDTNICIYAINKRSNELIEKIGSSLESGLYLSALTVAELEFGVENSIQIEKNRMALLKFISIFEIINFDVQDAIEYGKLKAKLKKNGTLIGPIDMLLAAQSISKNLIFVTNNTNEFKRIENLKIEDWSL
jgi:tRNA(fMet)-specific endonuclease VapC